MVNKFFSRLINGVKYKFLRGYKIGNYTVILPPDHRLDLYQKLFKYYDKKLSIIAAAIERKYKDISIVDIGANVGDTAALLRGSVSAPIVCVEGNPEFTALLERNVSRLPGVIKIVKNFIGDTEAGSRARIITQNGTARLEDAEGDACNVGFISYSELCEIKKDIYQTRLVKIDTDGYDFKILLSSIKEISNDDSVIFFEFDPSFLSNKRYNEPFDALRSMLDAGYLYYLIYDNFGNYMLSISSDHERIFHDLNCYLRQARRNGGGVNYYDICCFKECDFDLFKEIIQLENEM